MIKKLKHKKPLSILDFGSGSGTNIETLAKLGKVDAYETNLKTKKFLKLNYKKFSNVKIISKINKKYDLILAADVIEHIKNDKKIIKDLHNLLKKKGFLLITVPAFNFLFSSKDVALKHFRRYDKHILKNLLIKNFEIKKLSYFNFFLFIPIMISILFLKIKKKKFIKFAETTPTQYINFILKKFFSFEKYLLNFFNFPFGVSLVALVKKND